MFHFNTSFQTRKIDRGSDIDYFIDLKNTPIELHLDIDYLSRIQYPASRGILIRTSPTSDLVTLHLLKNVDLHSAYSNFEIDTKRVALSIDASNTATIISVRKRS